MQIASSSFWSKSKTVIRYGYPIKPNFVANHYSLAAISTGINIEINSIGCYLHSPENKFARNLTPRFPLILRRT
jgi:hypothetical protein